MRDKIIRFMRGRNGPDDLYMFLFGLYIVLFLINLFIDLEFLDLLELIVIILMFYRFFSKNIYKRNQENKAFLRLKKQSKNKLENLKNYFKETNYIYKKCPKCKSTLKFPMPYERGIKKVKCPKCGHRFKMFVFRKQKVEVIKKKMV